MPELIVVGGAPECGKSTLAAQLRAHLRGPWIDFGRLREFHLERACVAHECKIDVTHKTPGAVLDDVLGELGVSRAALAAAGGARA